MLGHCAHILEVVEELGYGTSNGPIQLSDGGHEIHVHLADFADLGQAHDTRILNAHFLELCRDRRDFIYGVFDCCSLTRCHLRGIWSGHVDAGKWLDSSYYGVCLCLQVEGLCDSKGCVAAGA